MVNQGDWIPDRGEIIWLNFDPRAGSEQAGRRPALVISPGIYNAKSRLALLCPITNQQKNYPYEVQLPAGLKTGGVVLSDHIKSLDWQARKASFIERTPSCVIDEVLAKIATLVS